MQYYKDSRTIEMYDVGWMDATGRNKVEKRMKHNDKVLVKWIINLSIHINLYIVLPWILEYLREQSP